MVDLLIVTSTFTRGYPAYPLSHIPALTSWGGWILRDWCAACCAIPATSGGVLRGLRGLLAGYGRRHEVASLPRIIVIYSNWDWTWFNIAGLWIIMNLYMGIPVNQAWSGNEQGFFEQCSYDTCIHMWGRIAMPDYGKTPTPCVHSSIGKSMTCGRRWR